MRIARRVGLSCLVLYPVLLVVAGGWARVGLRSPSCPQAGGVVVVDSAARVLSLCHDGRSDGSFRVALGRAGVGKRQEGDRKTPVGAFTLSAPQASDRFGVFVPVGYPNAVQRQQRFTGSSIGIHGPDRRFVWLGHMTIWIDWTAGCVAVGTPTDIEAIAAWVRRTGTARVEIR